jgi:S-adenosylhomocysteine hydrolase
MHTARQIHDSLYRQQLAQQIIPKLEVLDRITDLILAQQNLPNMNEIIFVGVQHILETTVTLFDALIKLGIQPQNMYFTGKSYSSSAAIEQAIYSRQINLIANVEQNNFGEFQKTFALQIKKLWDTVIKDLEQKDIKRIIILDDGGRCLAATPNLLKCKYSIVGIEQTRGGLYNLAIDRLPCAVIEVASSAVKKHVEPPLIAEAVLGKLKNYLKDYENPSQLVFGVVGNGSIGEAVINYLLRNNHNVVVWDEDANSFVVHKKIFRVSSIELLIANSNVIIGCTGRDITSGVDTLKIADRNKCFISCSSEDKEFLSLLKQIAQNNRLKVNPLNDIVYIKNKYVAITVPSGGFPINFDGSPWNVPANDIAITQGLLLNACVQALFLDSKLVADGIFINKHSRYCLDPYAQKATFKIWAALQHNRSYEQQFLDAFDDIDWIAKNSGGEYHENQYMRDCYQGTNIVPSYRSKC